MENYTRAEGLVLREIAGEKILVPVKGDLASLQRIFVLSPVAAHVWERLDGTRGLEAILDSILERFEVEPDEARSDLKEFVAQLQDSRLIHAAAPPPRSV